MCPDTKKIILEVAAVIAVWCAVGELLICIFMDADIGAVLGFLLGSVMAVVMFIHMGVSIETTLDMPDEESAKKKNVRAYAARTGAVAVILIAAAVSGYFNVLFIVFGMFGLKAGAYLQPLTDKIFSRFKWFL